MPSRPRRPPPSVSVDTSHETGHAPQPRRGYSRRADVPPQLVAALSSGLEPTRTLSELLVVDLGQLAVTIAPQVGLGAEQPQITAAAQRMAGLPFTQRFKGLANALYEAARTQRRRQALVNSLAAHRSDVVRSWGAYVLGCQQPLDLAQRIERGRRFAADAHMGVRESAWDALRPHLAAELPRGLELLGRWVQDDDPSVRRCAIEATRPRGVWCKHIEPLKADPARGLALLEPLRADPSRYVQKSVANWLNDASKSRPDWVRQVTGRWLAESPEPATRWIVNRALRTIDG